MKKVIERNIQGKKVLILFLITNVIYVIMLTITIPKVMNYASGYNLLDIMPTGYTVEYVKDLMKNLGAVGRNAYLYYQIPVDMVYPLSYAISYCLIIAYFLNKLNKLNSAFYYFCFLPILVGLFDYMENIGFIVIINQYPNFSNTLIKTTSVFTILKSFITTLFFSLLIIVLIILGIKTLEKRKKNKI